MKTRSRSLQRFVLLTFTLGVLSYANATSAAKTQVCSHEDVPLYANASDHRDALRRQPFDSVCSPFSGSHDSLLGCGMRCVRTQAPGRGPDLPADSLRRYEADGADRSSLVNARSALPSVFENGNAAERADNAAAYSASVQRSNRNEDSASENRGADCDAFGRCPRPSRAYFDAELPICNYNDESGEKRFVRIAQVERSAGDASPKTRKIRYREKRKSRGRVFFLRFRFCHRGG